MPSGEASAAATSMVNVIRFPFDCPISPHLCKVSAHRQLFRLTCSWESSTEGMLSGQAGRI